MSEVEAEVDAYLEMVAAIEAALHPVYILEMVQGLRPGDILHIQMGGEFSDGQPPFIPGSEECDRAKAEWEKVVPEGVNVIVTHVWEHATIIPVDSNA